MYWINEWASRGVGPLAWDSLLQPHLVLVAVPTVAGGTALARARLRVVLTRAACPVLLITRICMAVTLASEEDGEEDGGHRAPLAHRAPGWTLHR